MKLFLKDAIANDFTDINHECLACEEFSLVLSYIKLMDKPLFGALMAIDLAGMNSKQVFCYQRLVKWNLY